MWLPKPEMRGGGPPSQRYANPRVRVRVRVRVRFKVRLKADLCDSGPEPAYLWNNGR